MRKTNRQILPFVFLLFLSYAMLPVAIAESTNTESTNIFYLYKPTGNFNVGFKDVHWINYNICPDPIAPEKNAKYFSKNNKKFCRELMVRVYYPAKTKKDVCSSYPVYIINLLKKSLFRIQVPKQKKNIAEYIKKLETIKVQAKAGLPVMNKSFPVIIFNGGATSNYKAYTNLLINIASHGYIIVAINGSFLTTMKFPDGRIVQINHNIVKPKLLKLLYSLKYRDMVFVYNKINDLHNSNNIFRFMDLNKIGLLGHSAGAAAVVAMSHAYNNEIKVAVALDAPNVVDLGLSNKFDVFAGFSFPFLHIHSSNAQSFLNVPENKIKLLKNNFLITIKKKNDDDYFKHIDFTDMTLFKDIPLNKTIHSKIYNQAVYGTINGKKAMDIISDYIVEFFNKFL